MKVTKKTHQVIVLDTSVLYAQPQAYTIDELKALAPNDYIVPFTVIAELDMRMQRTDTRDRARAAINVLKQFGERGAFTGAVSCGEGSTLRIGQAGEEFAQQGLDMSLADDRILACAISQAKGSPTVILATTEFALYAKAQAFGLGGAYLERYAEVRTSLSRRERESLRQAWTRVEASDTAWKLCRRALVFLRLPVVRRLTASVWETNEPPMVAATLTQFGALSQSWTETTSLWSILRPTFSLDPPQNVDYVVKLIPMPDAATGYIGLYAKKRVETAEERAVRIPREEQTSSEREAFIVDVLLSRLSEVREFILDQVGEDFL